MSLNAYIGKRFAGLVLVSGILGAAYFVGPVEKFATLATTLGLIYGAYVGGQSYSDGQKR
jgi:hypothetical protein